MKKHILCFILLWCLLGVGMHSNGQVTATGEVKYTSITANTDELRMSDMQRLDYSSFFRLGADLAGGIIGDVNQGGRITLEVHSYDSTVANGKGPLVYGVYIVNTTPNYGGKAWSVPLGNHWGVVAPILSNNVKGLAWYYGRYVEDPDAPGTGEPGCANNEIGTTGASALGQLLLMAGLKVANFISGNHNGGNCLERFEPKQPVIIEVTIKNATLKKFKIPGIGEMDAAQYFKLNTSMRFFKSPEDFDGNSVMLNTHRGLWMDTAENSLTAYKAAIDNGFGMIEMDVMRTSDDTLFMLHDFELSRLTNSNIESDPQASKLFTTDSLAIKANYPGFHNFEYTFKYGINRSWSDLQSLKVRDRRGDVIPGEGLVRFSQVLDLLRGKVILDVDKVEEYFPKVWAMVKARGMQRQVNFKGSASKWTPKRLQQVFGEDARFVSFSPQFFYDTHPLIEDADSAQISSGAIATVDATNENFKKSIDMWLLADKEGKVQVHAFQFFPETFEIENPNSSVPLRVDPLLYPIDLSSYILNNPTRNRLTQQLYANNISNERKHVWQAEMPVDCFTGQNSSNNRVFFQDVKMIKKMTVEQVLESNATIIDTDRGLLRRQYLKKKGYEVH